MPAIEQSGQLVGGHQVLELAHHPAQRVLVRLQGEAALTHAQSRGLDVAGVQFQPDQHDKQHAHLQHRQRRVGQLEVVALPQRDRAETEKHQQCAPRKRTTRQMKQPEQQNQHVEHQERAAGLIQIGNQPGLPAKPQQHLRLGQAGVGKTQVAAAVKHREQRRLADDHQSAANGDVGQRFIVMAGEKRQPQQQQSQGIGAGREGKPFE